MLELNTNIINHVIALSEARCDYLSLHTKENELNFSFMPDDGTKALIDYLEDLTPYQFKIIYTLMNCGRDPDDRLGSTSEIDRFWKMYHYDFPEKGSAIPDYMYDYLSSKTPLHEYLRRALADLEGHYIG